MSSIPAAEPKPKGIKTRKSDKGDVPGVTRPMTYEEYLASPEEMARYDILDGWKVYRLYGEQQLPNPTRRHQRIQGNLYVPLRRYEQQTGRGQVIQPPCDVRITRRPLRNRQPGLLFISVERLARNPPLDDPAPLAPAPELVIEIVSPSDRPAVLAAKIADYRSVNVQEVWVVRAEAQTVEVVRLTLDEIETVATYGRGQTVASRAFSNIRVPVDEIFAE
jgi:Uma2 family endonuclease